MKPNDLISRLKSNHRTMRWVSRMLFTAGIDIGDLTLWRYARGESRKPKNWDDEISPLLEEILPVATGGKILGRIAPKSNLVLQASNL